MSVTREQLDKIPEKFYRGRHPKIRTVGALKKVLRDLPNNLRIEGGMGEILEAVVYNHGHEDPNDAVLMFSETDERYEE